MQFSPAEPLQKKHLVEKLIVGIRVPKQLLSADPEAVPGRGSRIGNKNSPSLAPPRMKQAVWSSRGPKEKYSPHQKPKPVLQAGNKHTGIYLYFNSLSLYHLAKINESFYSYNIKLTFKLLKWMCKTFLSFYPCSGSCNCILTGAVSRTILTLNCKCVGWKYI